MLTAHPEIDGIVVVNATGSGSAPPWPTLGLRLHKAAIGFWNLPKRPDDVRLTGGFFFVLMRLAAVFGSLFRISGLFSGHIAGIVVVLSFWVLAGLLLIWIFVVGHQAFLWEGVTKLNGTQVVKFQRSVAVTCFDLSSGCLGMVGFGENSRTVYETYCF